MRDLGFGAYELEVVENGVVSLPPQAAEGLGLIPGDILCLEARFPRVLGMNIYRMNLVCWGDMMEYHRNSLSYWVHQWLSRPLTAVEPGALPIPAEVFPLAAGDKVELRVSCRLGVEAVDLSLWRRDGDKAEEGT